MTLADEALVRLVEGNARYVAGRQGPGAGLAALRREELLAEQRPFAVVLACSDSRVPVEMVFDQGLGDLFVIRVAGAIVAPSQMGSVEFAAERFGTRLVVVLGHSRCGAVEATVEALAGGAAGASPGLRSIVDRIRPALTSWLGSDRLRDPASVLDEAVRANVEHSVRQLRDGSTILQGLAAGGLRVVGAVYDLATGRVEFLDVPEHGGAAGVP